MSDLFKLDKKVAIVTGGYGYLGYEMTKALYDYGATVYVAGRDKAKYDEKFGKDEGVKFVEIDISNLESIKEGFNLVYKTEGQIDILVNNATYGATNDPEKMTAEEWTIGIDGSLNSIFKTIKEVVPHMKKNGGKIINIASMYGVVIPDFSIYEGNEQFLNPPNYGTAKAGVIHLTKYYASFLAKYNININCISPGPFPSPQIQKYESFKKNLISKVPLKRIGQPEDLSGVMILLASCASDYITGQNICVDGGWTL